VTWHKEHTVFITYKTRITGSKLVSFGSLTSKVPCELNFLQSNPIECGFIVPEVDSEIALGNRV